MNVIAIRHEMSQPPGWRAQCRIRDYSGEVADCFHRHVGFDEIVLVSAGSGIHVTGQGEYDIRQGDVFLIPEGYAHGYKGLHNLRIVNLLFIREDLEAHAGPLAETAGYDMFFRNGGRFNEAFRFGNRLTLGGAALDGCIELAGRMLLEENARRDGFEVLVWNWFLEICVTICRGFDDAGRSGGGEIGDLCRLLRYMRKNHGDSTLNMARLAEYCRRSPSSLARLFRRGLDTGPVEYLHTVRLEEAARELRETGDSVSEIAYRHGFTDSNYFSTRFSRRFGMPPREYRKRALLADRGEMQD